MSKSKTVRRPQASLLAIFLLIAATAIVGLSVGSAAAANKGSKVVAKEAKVKGKTILTATNGHTLYSLSVEKHGKFICTKSSGCTALWRPLTVPAGVTPKGPVKLGTVKRPDGGGVQVTYLGRPLYTFIEDKRAGQVEGEGVKDVGTWHPAAVSGG
jgi:predicted lipoprotein with Yx(FWY)xxD motif